MNNTEDNIESAPEQPPIQQPPSDNIRSSASVILNRITLIIFSIYVVLGFIILFEGLFIYSSFPVRLILLFSILNLCYRIYYEDKLRRKIKDDIGYFFVNLRLLLSGLLFIGAVLHNLACYACIKQLSEDVPILSNASIGCVIEWQEGMHSGRERYIVATLKKETFLSYIKQSEPVHPDHQVFNKYNYLYLNISPKSYEGFLISNQYEPNYLLFQPDQGKRVKFFLIRYPP